MKQGVRLTYDNFLQICQQKSIPDSLNGVLLALWFDFQDDWDTAHRIVQKTEGNDASWVHAYLHRKEGDLANATYWYSWSGKTRPDGGLDEEWELISRSLLESISG